VKLTDEERTKLIQWVENEEYLPFKQMQFKCLVQRLQQSEKDSWDEVKKLKAEIDRLREALTFYADEMKYVGQICYYDEGEMDAYYEVPDIVEDKGLVARQAIECIKEVI